jgi:hypothetical protein
MSSATERMHENVQFTLELAEKILQSAGEDSHDAVLRAVGTLAQVILFTTRDEYRDEVIDRAIGMLRDYLRLLDEIAGVGATEH